MPQLSVDVNLKKAVSYESCEQVTVADTNDGNTCVGQKEEVIATRVGFHDNGADSNTCVGWKHQNSCPPMTNRSVSAGPWSLE